MILHFLVEGPSEKSLLIGLLPRLIPKHKFRVYLHQGKGRLSRTPDKKPDPKQRGLLDQLPATLRGLGRTLNPATDRVVVLLDADDDDCVELLNRLKEMMDSIDPAPTCLFRIAIEEVESWYLGDWGALKRAFPKADRKKWGKYRPDARIGAWELFQKVIGDAAERKLHWAEKMGVELTLGHANKSPSFLKFCEGVLRQAGDLTPKQPASQRPKKRAR